MVLRLGLGSESAGPIDRLNMDRGGRLDFPFVDEMAYRTWMDLVEGVCNYIEAVLLSLSFSDG